MIGHTPKRQPVAAAFVLLLLSAVTAVPAEAQSMDYGALESLFNGPVTTSATGTPQRDTDVPVNMTIVTADDIRRSGARDITGVLRHVPDVDVLQWGTDNSDLSIRGFDQAYSSGTLVMIDGRQVYADYYGFIPWSALPVELGAIRQIEVVKGPNDALFGFNAAGGAINIITYNPRYDDVGTLTLRAGVPSLGEISGVASLRFDGRGGVRISAGYRNNSDFSSAIPVNVRGNDRVNNHRFAVDGRFIYALTDNIEAALEASHTQTETNEVSPNYAIQTSRYLINSLDGHVTASTDIGMLKLRAYSNWIGWNGVPSATFGTLTMHDQVTVANAEDVFRAGSDHTFRLAVEYRHTAVNTSPVTGGMVSHDVWSGSSMWQWQVAQNLTVTSALRFDHLSLHRSGSIPASLSMTNAAWDRDINDVSYNFGAVWLLGTDDTLRFLTGRGVELPSLVKSGALVLETPYFSVTGNPAVKPTDVTNYEIVWGRQLPALDARVQVSLFHLLKEHISAISGETVVSVGGVVAMPENIGNSHAEGISVTAGGAIDSGWDWQFAYRWEKVRDHFVASSSNGVNFVDFQGGTPAHVLKANVGWHDERLAFDVFGHWQSATYGLNWPGNALGLSGFSVGSVRVPIPAYVSVDARAAVMLADWATLSLSGQNVLQGQQRQTSGPAVERQLYITLTLTN